MRLLLLPREGVTKWKYDVEDSNKRSQGIITKYTRILRNENKNENN